MTDEYADDTYRWWHLSKPPPELLEAVVRGWIAPPGRVLDLGCGLGVELAELARVGFEAVGIEGRRNDVSEELVHEAFGRWTAAAIERRPIVSDTRSMDAIVARLEKPG